MELTKKRIPPQSLANLLLQHRYLDGEQLPKCLELQLQNPQDALEDVLRRHQIIPDEKISPLIGFSEFIKMRLSGIAFCQIAIQKKQLTSDDLNWILMTQRAIFILKNKPSTIDELLMRQGKLSATQRDEIASFIQQLLSPQSDELFENALKYLLREDEVHLEWQEKKSHRIATSTEVPPSKFEQEKTTLKINLEKNGKTPIENLQHFGIENVKALEADEGHLHLDVTSHQLQDLYDISRTEPFENPQPIPFRHVQPLTLAVIVTIIICSVLGATIALGISWHKKTEVKEIAAIRSLVEKKEHIELEERCRKFCQSYPKSSYYRESHGYLQQALLIRAGIAFRQGKLPEAQKVIAEIGTIDEKQTEQLQRLVDAIAQAVKLNERQAVCETYKNNVDQLLKQSKLADAQVELEKLQEWLKKQGEGVKIDNFLSQSWQRLRTAQDNLEIARYRYYPAGELSQQATSPDVVKPTEIMLTLFALTGEEKRANFADMAGHFFMIAGGYLYALHAASGEIDWVEYLGEGVLFSPIFIAGLREHFNMNLVDKVLVVASHQNALVMLNANTGERIWAKTMPEAICVQPVLFKDKIYVGCLNRYYYQIELSTGDVQGAYWAGGIPQYPAVVDKRGDLLYLFSRDRIYGYDFVHGKLAFSMDAPGRLAAPVVAIHPYLYIFADRDGNTLIHSYLLSKKGVQPIKANPDRVPGNMSTPASLAGGILAVATTTHLGIFGINPANQGEALFPLSPPIALADNSPAHMRFSNFVQCLLLAQKNLVVLEGFSSTGKIEETTRFQGKNDLADLETYLPIQKCGSAFFWAQRAMGNRYFQGICVKLETGKSNLVWQKQVACGVYTDALSTPDRRILFMSYDGSIHEVYVDAKGEIYYRQLARQTTGTSCPVWIAGKQPRLLVVGNNLQVVDAITGWPTSWTPKITFQGELGHAVCQDNVIFMGTSKGVFAISADNGQEKYQGYSKLRGKPLRATSFGGIPVFYQNSIIIGCDDGDIYQLKLASGDQPYLEEAWKITTEGPIRGRPLIHEGILYCGSQDQHMYAVDLHARKLLWKFSTQGSIDGYPVLYDNILYFGSDDGYLYAVVAKTGQIGWKENFAGKIKNSPLYHKQKLYVVSIAGDLRAYDLKQKKRLWEIRIGGPVLSSPVALGNYVFVASANGFIYCIK